MDRFNWVVVNKAGQVLAGAPDREKADIIAKALEGEVKEMPVAEITGDFSFDKTTVWFDGANGEDNFNQALANAVGVKFPNNARGGGNMIPLGYVTITFKAATKPPEAE